MNIAVLILSLALALGQAGLGWAMLTLLPASLPLPVAVGCVFAGGMLLSFLFIITIGALGITKNAADFVQSHLGRVLVLALGAAALIFGLGTGAEFGYEGLDRLETGMVRRPASTPDVVFVLDYSYSMRGSVTGDGIGDAPENQTRLHAMKNAFSAAVQSMADGQRICVVYYDDNAKVIQDWVALGASTRQAAIDIVNDAESGSATDFSAALKEANGKVRQAVDLGHNAVVVMLSDGEDGPVNIPSVAPDIHAHRVPVYTMGIGGGDFSTLRAIADDTGGSLLVSADDAVEITRAFRQQVVQAVEENTTVSPVPDTLLTPNCARSVGTAAQLAVYALLLLGVSFCFRLIVNICIGNNANSFAGHLLSALLLAALAAAAVIVPGKLMSADHARAALAGFAVYWPLMMTQMVFNQR